MKKEKTVILDRAGVNEASETVRQWLEEAGTEHRDITRIRLILQADQMDLIDCEILRK
jgi:anti-sigma regulatory factor (Ser/Thr protein kinase)